VELYSLAVSPFAARVRISIRAKGLSVRIIDNPDVASEAFGKLNPLRRVPVLVLDDGRSIAESETIVDYLEDNYPKISLLPVDPLERARVRLVARVAELYVFPAVVQILMSRGAPSTGDAKMDSLFGVVQRTLHELESFLVDTQASWRAFGDRLTTADGALAPFLFYVDMLAKTSGRALLDRQPRLERFWAGAQSDPVLSPVLQEMGQGMMRARG
jgi:glutathione S-transferase